MGLVFGLMVKKMLKKIWHDDPAGYTAALERHAAFVNITVMLASFVGGIAMSMEERIKAGELPPEFVNDVKAVLMGQLSGVGDTIFLTTIRVVAACIAVSMAAEGNPLGPILFPLIFTSRSTSCVCGVSSRAMSWVSDCSMRPPSPASWTSSSRTPVSWA